MRGGPADLPVVKRDPHPEWIIVHKECCHTRELRPPRHRALEKLEVGVDSGGCLRQKTWARLGYVPLEEQAPVTYVNPCLRSVESCLRNRVLMAVPPVEDWVGPMMRRQLNKLFKLFPAHALTPMTHQQVIDRCKTAKKRVNYTRADENMKHMTVRQKIDTAKRWSRVHGFIKDEGYYGKTADEVDPRAIQRRDYEYILSLLCWTKPIEGMLSKVVDPKASSQTPVFMKGLNPVQVGNHIHTKFLGMQERGRVVVLGLDVSRFDGHVQKVHLQEEHNFDRKFYKQHPDYGFLKALLDAQLVNKGKMNERQLQEARYVVDGGRMSGDPNTGKGNAEIMYSLVMGFLKTYGVTVYDNANMGDDHLLFLLWDDWERLMDKFTPFFFSCGMTLKVESVAETMEDIVFCQQRPVLAKRVGGEYEYRMVRDFRKVMCVKTVKYRNAPGPLVQTIAMCESNLNNGISLIEDYFLVMRQLYPAARPLGRAAELETFGYRMSLMSDDMFEEDHRTVVSFCQAFGITTLQYQLSRCRIAEWPRKPLTQKRSMPYGLSFPV